uniref:Stc1 n=1 Tax=Arundo donax TaxID=35708 RepID=A0A0A9DEF0_ARUDO
MCDTKLRTVNLRQIKITTRIDFATCSENNLAVRLFAVQDLRLLPRVIMKWPTVIYYFYPLLSLIAGW